MHTMQQVNLDGWRPEFPVWNVVNVDSLKEQLGSIYDSMENILAKADEEGRDLTPSECIEYDSMKAEFATIEARLGRQTQFQAITETMRPGRRSSPEGPNSGGSFGRDDGTGIIVGKALDGKSIKAYMPNERLPMNAPRVDYDFQEWARAAYTGEWDRIKNATQTEGIGADGGFTVPTPLSQEIIEIVRNKTQVVRAGARTIPMTSKTLSFAKQESDPVAYWRGELQTITQSKGTFSMVNFNANVVACLITMSEELLMDAPNAGVLLQNALGEALALALDKACLVGSGIAQPLGIVNTPGVQTLSAVGTLSTIGNRYTILSTAIGKLWAVNFQPTALLMNGKTAALFDALIDAEDRPLEPPQSWSSYQHLVTNQLEEASNVSTAILGDFSQEWIGMRMGVKLEFDRSATVNGTNGFTDLAVHIRAWMRCDAMPVRPSAFVVIPGITTGP